MWATLRRDSAEFTWPTNSSISLGLLPAAVMRVGEAMSFGMNVSPAEAGSFLV